MVGTTRFELATSPTQSYWLTNENDLEKLLKT
jgi:hypothetical protein